MPTVAELDVQINAKDDATATILALDALIKELDEGDVDIEIDVDDNGARARIAELIAELRELSTADTDIDIELDTGKARTEIARLKAMLAAIGDEHIDIKADVDTDSIRRARIDMGKFSNAASNASRQTNGVAAAVISLGAALIPIGAVAIGGIGAIGAALTTAAIGVGLFGAVAMTVFGGVKDALTDLHAAQKAYNAATTDAERDKALAKTKAIMEGLNPAEREMVEGVEAFRKAWKTFAMEFQPQIFQIAGEGLKGIAAILPSLSPIVDGAAKAFLSLERSAVAALQGPFWQGFIGLMGSSVQPILEGLGRSIGNLVTGFAALVGAFMPLTMDFTTGLEGMTASFSKWAQGLAQSQGFKDFVAYIRENTPLVLALIGSIVNAFIAIVKAGAPLGEALVIIATGLFDCITAFQQAHPLAATLALTLLAVLAATLKLLGPVLAIGRLLVILASGFSGIVTAVTTVITFLGGLGLAFLGVVAIIGLLVGAFIYAYTHFEGFRNLVNTVAQAVVNFGTMVYNAIVTWLGQAAAWLTSTFGPAVQLVIDFVVQQFNKIIDWVHTNAAVFQAAWSNIATFFTTLWQILWAIVSTSMAGIASAISTGLAIISAVWGAIWPTLLTIIKGIWEAIKGVISGVLDIILGLLLVWGGIFAGDWGAIWNGIVQILKGIWEIISGVVRGAFMILQAIVDAGMAVVFKVMSVGWNLILAGLRSAWTTAVSLLTTAWNAIKTAVSASMNFIQNVINAGWRLVLSVITTVMGLVLAGLRSAWSTAQSLVSSAVSTIRSLVSSAWSSMLSAIRTAMSNVVSAIRTGFSNALSAVRSFGSSAVALVRGLAGQFLSAGRHIMSSLAQGVRDGIGAAVGAVRDAIGKMTSLIPHSPAKEGPMSGRGYPLYGGRAIAESLAQGVNDRAGLVKSALGDLISMGQFGAGGLQVGLGSSNKGSGSSGGGGSGINISIAPGAIVLQIGEGVSPSDARTAFDGAAGSLADELLTAIRRR